ncbi:MAG TPA: acyl-CoA dehydrogenase family protein, partial [Pseudomonadales bacterium]
MPAYKAPLNDIKFVLKDVFNAYELWSSMDATRDVTSDLVAAILGEGAKICETMLAPLNREGDETGCQFNNGEVATPKGFKEAYQTFAAGGWQGLGGHPAYGGQGLPKMLTVLFEEMVWASNSAFALYPSLSTGCSLALETHAGDEIKNIYLEKLYTGQWTGTMCLTEAHAGTDLGIIKTRAVDNNDGSYSITGTKIFITGGEHDYVENIVHLVLAKLPDAPAGVKGISLFLVPKYIVNEEGELGERNGATCGSIEHKMGIKAASTCVMNFDNAKAYLIGKLNEGMACMFTMMNYERLSIGIQGL